VTSLSSEPQLIVFGKEVVKEGVRASLLTESLKTVSGAGLQRRESPTEVLGKEVGEDKLSASMLPSAWDSDDEFEN
jgi:hypothetical protein